MFQRGFRSVDTVRIVSITRSSVSAVVIGIALITFRKPFANSVVAWQNKVWGFHEGEREREIDRFVAVVVGAGFIVFGVATMLWPMPVRS